MSLSRHCDNARQRRRAGGAQRAFRRRSGAVQDITERGQHEARLERLNARLEQQVEERTATLREQAARLRTLAHELAAQEHRERRRLASLLHDDLQQLLAAATLRLDRLDRPEAGQERRANPVADIHELVARAQDVARDLTRQLRPPLLYEGGLIPALRWLAGETKRLYGLEVSLEPGQGDISFNDDVRAFLFEAVRELLFNVIKHAGVRTAVVRVQRRGPDVLLEVQDAGRGTSLAAPRDPGRRKAEWGLFSLQERLVTLGGHLEIESQPGGGTSARLVLPVVPQTAEAERETTASRSRQEDTARRKACIRVLLVDDHVLVRQGIANMLAADERFLVVAEAGDGAEALGAVETYRPDVVLMDLQMPRMNGFAATEAIRQRWPEVQVIGLSVVDDDTAAHALREAGAAAFVSKSEGAHRVIETILDHARPR